MNFLARWYLEALNNPDILWTTIGFVGTALFGLRFVIQWLSSERKGHSVIPLAFWYFSIAGGAVTLAYAVHIKAWPLILGQGTPLLIYVRNLWMVLRDRQSGRVVG